MCKTFHIDITSDCWVGVVYTPIAVGRDGKIYTENDGDMFVEGK
jgi:hypothetical protein